MTEVAPGDSELDVVFEPPPGQKLDERWGPATRLLVAATPSALLKSGEGRDTALCRTLTIDTRVDDGVLHVAAMAASCDTECEGAACHVHQQDWGVPDPGCARRSDPARARALEVAELSDPASIAPARQDEPDPINRRNVAENLPKYGGAA